MKQRPSLEPSLALLSDLKNLFTSVELDYLLTQENVMAAYVVLQAARLDDAWSDGEG